MTLWSRIKPHLKVFGIAVVFGLGSYVIIMILNMIGRHFGATI
jgi:hypothetical protein